MNLLILRFVLMTAFIGSTMALDNEVPSTPSVVTETALTAPIPSTFAIRINAGSQEEGYDSKGNYWMPDDYYDKGWTASKSDGIIVNVDQDDEFIYRTARHGAGDGLRYNIPVPNGDYEVILHFMEFWHNDRIIELQVENTFHGNLDTVEEAGGRMIAWSIPFQVKVDDGFVDIDLIQVSRQGLINGMEILLAATEPFVPTYTPNETIAPTVVPTVLGSLFAIRINAGSKEEGYDSKGNYWMPDDYFTGGWTALKSDGIIANVDSGDEFIYRTARHGAGAGLRYNIPVPNGDYEVILHFMEFWHTDRIIELQVENTFMDNFDTVAEAGGRMIAWSIPFYVKVDDGFVDIDLTKVSRQCLINGLEILLAATPTLLPTSMPSKTTESSMPSSEPSAFTTSKASMAPSFIPSAENTSDPSATPSSDHTLPPFSEHSMQPSSFLGLEPSTVPSSKPSKAPSEFLSSKPSTLAGSEPCTVPSSYYPSSPRSPEPSLDPSSDHCLTPTSEPSPPSEFLSAQPSPTPTLGISAAPSSDQSLQPSLEPSAFPSLEPSMGPSMESSTIPSYRTSGTFSSFNSLVPSIASSSDQSENPNVELSSTPTLVTSAVPSSVRSVTPTGSSETTVIPSFPPSAVPSSKPSIVPISAPTSVPIPETSMFEIRINAGSKNEGFDSKGNYWAPDDYYDKGWTASKSDGIIVNVDHDDEFIYRTARHGAGKGLRYNIPVPNGDYEVILHFMEFWHNDRIIELQVENTFMNNFDTVAEPGGRMIAWSIPLDVMVEDESVDITFNQVSRQALVNGIEIIQIDRAPTISPIPTASPVTSPPVTIITGSWTEIDPDSNLIQRHEACSSWVNGKLYLIGGRTSMPVSIWDPVTDVWTTGPSPGLLHHMQCVPVDDSIWIVSSWTKGFPREANTDSIYIYNTITNTWSTKPGLPEHRRRGGAASVLYDNKIWVSHGNRGGHETESEGSLSFAESLPWLDYFDLELDEWVIELPDAPSARDHTGGGVVKGRICIAGGRNGGLKDWPSVAQTDCYDPATGTWSVEANIPETAGGSLYGTSCDGRLLVAGGEEKWSAKRSFQAFDGEKWTVLPEMKVPRHGVSLGVDCENKVIYAASGAISGGGSAETRSVEAYYFDGSL